MVVSLLFSAVLGDVLISGLWLLLPFESSLLRRLTQSFILIGHPSASDSYVLLCRAIIFYACKIICEAGQSCWRSVARIHRTTFVYGFV